MYKFIAIKKDKFEDYPESSILRAEEYAVILKAEEIIEHATKKAEAIVAKAQSEAQDIAEKARSNAVAEVMKQTSATVLNTLNICNKFLANSSVFLHKTVIDAVSKIISGYDSKEITFKMIEASLHKYRCSKVLLKVNPKSLDYISQKISELKVSFPTIVEIKIAQSNEVHETGCILETDIGNIQATLDSQLQALEDTHVLPINPAFVKAIVEKDPKKLEEVKSFLMQALENYDQESQGSEEINSEIEEQSSDTFAEKPPLSETETASTADSLATKVDTPTTEEDVALDTATSEEADTTSSEASIETPADTTTTEEDVTVDTETSEEADTTSSEASIETPADTPTTEEDVTPDTATSAEADTTSSEASVEETPVDTPTTGEDITPPDTATSAEADVTSSEASVEETAVDTTTTGEDITPPDTTTSAKIDTTSSEASIDKPADTATTPEQATPDTATSVASDTINTNAKLDNSESQADNKTNIEESPEKKADSPDAH